MMQTIGVGPFRVSDTDTTGLVGQVVDLFTDEPSQASLVFALHVGGLNSRSDVDFVEAMEHADLVYADGGSVVALARLAGATTIQRAPTTDVGWDILHALAGVVDRKVRVALLGGPEGLAERAGQVLEEGADVEVVYTTHGYHRGWDQTFRELETAAPDVVIVGLGAPREMVWCHTHRDRLPAGIILTCGGWFGHLTGDEFRAPKLLRRSGVEWVARLSQAPTRLGPRYAQGAWSSLVMALPALRRRRRAAAMVRDRRPVPHTVGRGAASVVRRTSPISMVEVASENGEREQPKPGVSIRS